MPQQRGQLLLAATVSVSQHSCALLELSGFQTMMEY